MKSAAISSCGKKPKAGLLSPLYIKVSGRFNKIASRAKAIDEPKVSLLFSLENSKHKFSLAVYLLMISAY